MANFYGSYIGYGSGSGASAELMQGEFYGYCHGGHQAGPSAYDRIDRWSYSADTNATDVGNLAPNVGGSTGATDGLYGFVGGGWTTGYSRRTDVQKYDFASATTDATDNGDLALDKTSAQGCSDMLAGYGHHNGGYMLPYNAAKQKYAFVSNVTGTNTGDLSIKRHAGGGSNDFTHGYNQTGYNEGEASDNTTIDRFPFASDGTSVNVGDVTQGRGGTDNACASTTRGYTVQGYSISSGGYSDRIDNHTFAASVTATDVGNCSTTNQGNGANQSVTYGYSFGGQPPATITTIWKWSFASDTQDAPDTGADLSLARVYCTGTSH